MPCGKRNIIFMMNLESLSSAQGSCSSKRRRRIPRASALGLPRCSSSSGQASHSPQTGAAFITLAPAEKAQPPMRCGRASASPIFSGGMPSPIRFPSSIAFFSSDLSHAALSQRAPGDTMPADIIFLSAVEAINIAMRSRNKATPRDGSHTCA